MKIPVAPSFHFVAPLLDVLVFGNRAIAVGIPVLAILFSHGSILEDGHALGNRQFSIPVGIGALQLANRAPLEPPNRGLMEPEEG